MVLFNATAVLESTYGRNVNRKVASIPTPAPKDIRQKTVHR
jgi:hypothetical protein